MGFDKFDIQYSQPGYKPPETGLTKVIKEVVDAYEVKKLYEEEGFAAAASKLQEMGYAKERERLANAPKVAQKNLKAAKDAPALNEADNAGGMQKRTPKPFKQTILKPESPATKKKRIAKAKKKADRATRIANAKPSTRKSDIKKCSEKAKAALSGTDSEGVATPGFQSFVKKCRKEATVNRAARAGRKKKKEEEIRLEGFDEQAFLLDNLDIFTNTNGDGKAYNYRNFLQIEDDDPRITMNKLIGLGLDGLNDLTTPQLSGLIPQIKLLKQVSDGKKTTTLEFPFNKFTTFNSIKNSAEGRGTDVGLVKLNWKDTGGQPWTTGKSFEGTMVLNFQSVEAIFKERGGISFAELMELQDKTLDKADLLGRNKEKAQTHTTGNGDRKRTLNLSNRRKDKEQDRKTKRVEVFGLCTDEYTKIILDVGWSIPKSSVLNLTSLRTREGVKKQASIADQLSNMRRRYILYIYHHEITVTENGHIDLTLSFTAAIEGMALSTQSDILNIDDTNFWNQPGDIRDAMVQLDETEREVTNATAAIEREEATAKTEKRNVKKRFMAKQRKARKDAEKRYEQQKSDLDNMAYRKLFVLIKSSVYNVGGSNRVFWFDLTPTDINFYTQLLAIQAKKWTVDKHTTLKEEKRAIDEYVAKVQAIKEKVSKPTDETTGGGGWMQYLVQGSPKDKDNLKKAKDLAKAGKAVKTAQGYAEKKDGNARIQYVFLGDIIEAVMSIIYEPRNMIGNKTTAVKGKRCKFLKKGLKLMVGSIRIIDPWTQKERLIAISDIPVSLNYFKAWWYDNAVGKRRKRYTLLPFLKDLCGKLISNVMAPERYGQKPGYQLMFKTVPIVLKDGNPFDKEWDKGGSRSVKERINVNTTMPGGRLAKTKGKQNEYSEWLYIYANGGPKHIRGKSQWQPLGFYKETSKTEGDKKVNIPHFVVGSDKGIIKNIKFHRTKIPLQMEMAIEQRAKGQSDKNPRANLLFQSFYNADLTLFGNPAFKIGQWIYINPRSMGISPNLNFNKWNTADLNIGGYYQINGVNNRVGDGEFFTELKCIQTIGMMQIKKLREQESSGRAKTA